MPPRPSSPRISNPGTRGRPDEPPDGRVSGRTALAARGRLSGGPSAPERHSAPQNGQATGVTDSLVPSSRSQQWPRGQRRLTDIPTLPPALSRRGRRRPNENRPPRGGATVGDGPR